MRIQGGSDNINLNNTAKYSPEEMNAKKVGNEPCEGKGLVVKAGNLNLGAETIEEKRKQAQQMALGIVSDAFEGDREIDEDLDVRRKHIRDLNAENYEYTKELKRIDELRTDLVESYGITEDSQEHADLELLRKEQGYFEKNGQLPILTEEEQERLAQIKKNGITDYQQQMLDLDKLQKHWQGEIDKNIELIKEENAIISGVKLERLKLHEMVDAKKQSEDVLKAASASIIGELITEAKEHVDEEIAEDKEKAEAAEEKDEELKEKLDEARAERKAKEEQLEEMCELESVLDEVSQVKQAENMPDVKKSLESIVAELKLTMQDLSGAVVDDIV
ncbi:MAG: hypothetical protein IKK96_02120 [Lachnospiraceae bacterium]|nr:hypothetical protein [Lachnospiraceae bacterium]